MNIDISNQMSGLKYRPDIDGLRGIAVLSVVVYHYFPEVIKGGFTGVDIFFVISGYLISKIIFTSIYRDNFSFFTFYVQRIKRIFPALISVLATCFGIGWFVLLPHEFEQLGGHITGSVLFVSNFIFWREAGYFDNSAETKPLLHLWSLGIEWQFYIIFPVVVWLVWRAKKNLLAIILAICVASFFLNILKVRIDPIGTFYLPHTRFWELIAGTLLAYVSMFTIDKYCISKSAITLRNNLSFKKSSNLNNVLAIFGLSLICCGLFFINKNSTFPGLLAAISVLGTVFIISAGPQAWFNRCVLSSKPLVWFGLISFPLYLWHWPLLSFLRIMEEDRLSTQLSLVSIMVSIFVSYITYKLIERPVRLFGGWSSRVIIFLLFSAQLIIGFAGFIVYQQNGMTHRISSEIKHISEIMANPYPATDHVQCDQLLPEFRNAKFDDCVIYNSTPNQKNPSIIFIGDSHTKQFRSTEFGEFGRGPIMLLTKSECLPFANDVFMGKKNCHDIFEKTLQYIQEKNSIQIIVLSSYWAYLMSGYFESKGDNWRIAAPPSSEQVAAFRKSFSLFINKANASGKFVIFVMDIPDLNFNINTCFDTRPFSINAKDIKKHCSMDESSYINRIKPIDNILNEILQDFPMVKVFNPRDMFCYQQKCFASDGRLPYYTNGDHLNHHGAKIVTDGLLKFITAELDK